MTAMPRFSKIMQALARKKKKDKRVRLYSGPGSTLRFWGAVEGIGALARYAVLRRPTPTRA